MSPTISSKNQANQLIKSLRPADRALIQSHLKPVVLKVRTELEKPGSAIANLYFLDSGIASVVSTPDPKKDTEVGLIGCEGVTGLAIILGSDRSPYHTYMQVAGTGQRISAKNFHIALGLSETVRAHFLHYANAFAIQIAETAAANARGKVEQRLARWVLMAHDRLVGDEIPLTHEFLAVMLGIRRASVTEALLSLERQELTAKRSQGVFSVLNRKGLEEIAGGFYGVPECEYKRLMD